MISIFPLLTTKNILKGICIWRRKESFHFFFCYMQDEEAFSHWYLLNWEAKGISLNFCWGLGSKYMCLLFNSDVATCQVLQYGIWNIVRSLAYVQSWRADFNPKDHGQATYTLWLELPILPAEMQTFVDLFAHISYA